MKGLSELVLATAEIKPFADGVDVQGALLEAQLRAFDMKDELEPYDLSIAIQGYAYRCAQQVISEENPEWYSGNWEDDSVWPGEIVVGGFHVRHGRFMDPNTGFRFRCSRCKAYDRAGSGMVFTIQTTGGTGQETPAHQAAELYSHELREGFYVAGIRICDPHVNSYTMHQAVRELLEKGYGIK